MQPSPFGRCFRWFLSADSNWRSGAQDMHSCSPLDRVLVPDRSLFKIRDRLSRALLPTQRCRSPFSFTWPKLRGARERRALLDMFKETAVAGMWVGTSVRPKEEQFRSGPCWHRQGTGQAEEGKECVPQRWRSNTATPSIEMYADIIVSPEWYKQQIKVIPTEQGVLTFLWYYIDRKDMLFYLFLFTELLGWKQRNSPSWNPLLHHKINEINHMYTHIYS